MCEDGEWEERGKLFIWITKSEGTCQGWCYHWGQKVRNIIWQGKVVQQVFESVNICTYVRFQTCNRYKLQITGSSYCASWFLKEWKKLLTLLGCCIIYLRIRFLKSSSVIPHSCFIPRSEAEIYWLIFSSLPDWIISIIMTFYIFLIAGKFDLIWSYFLIHSLISSCLSWKSLGNRSCPWQTKSEKCKVWFGHTRSYHMVQK